MPLRRGPARLLSLPRVSSHVTAPHFVRFRGESYCGQRCGREWAAYPPKLDAHKTKVLDARMNGKKLDLKSVMKAHVAMEAAAAKKAAAGGSSPAVSKLSSKSSAAGPTVLPGRSASPGKPMKKKDKSASEPAGEETLMGRAFSSASSLMTAAFSTGLATKAAPDEAAVRRAFAHFDVDGNGELDFAEFKRFMCSGGAAEAFTDKELKKVMKDIDLDKSGTIDIEEYTQWLFNKAALKSARHYK